jgi:hypothetical protein
MDKKIRNAWVRKLRERGRVQGRAALCTETDGVKYQCCLDVLVEAHMEAVPSALTREVMPEGRVYYRQVDATRYGGTIGGLLPPVTAEWAQTAEAPYVHAPKGWRRWLYPRRYRRSGARALTYLNDTRQESFRTIARMIRWGIVE